MTNEGRAINRDSAMLLKIVSILVGLLGLTAMCLTLWRWSDLRSDQASWARLAALRPAVSERFSHDMLEGLPEPAARYFRFTIAEGAPLVPITQITMSGEFRMGDQSDPKPLSMTARQILAPPHGFMWQMQASNGTMRVSGSDSDRWTRFWALGLLPVARASGTENHRRSAFGRLAIEAVVWAPASVLPGPGVTWAPVDENRAKVTLSAKDLTQEVIVHVAPNGRPLDVSIQRWSNENPTKEWRTQPFGGLLSDFADFDGYRLATRAEVGHFFGTQDWFPFFLAEDLRFSFQPD